MKGAWKLISATVVVGIAGLVGGKSANAEQGGVPGRVTGSRVNVRSGPKSGLTILSIASKDQSVRVYDYKDGWYQIGYPANAVCWVNSRVLDVKGAGTKAKPAPGTVRTDSINVRASGNLKAVVVGTAKRGETLQIVGKVSDWYKIKPPAYARSWIYGRYVQIDEDVIGPIAADATGIDNDATAFTRCEARYLTAKKGGADVDSLTDVLDAYRELAAADSTSEAIRAKCERRVDGIVANFTPAQKHDLQIREQQRVAAKIEAEKQRIVAIRAAAPKPDFLAQGTLHPLSTVKKGGPTHRLKTGDITLYRLESKSVNLNDFVGKRIGVLGQVTTPPSTWGGQTQEIITVTDVHELR
jgi:SH3-like domain-containing protein